MSDNELKPGHRESPSEEKERARVLDDVLRDQALRGVLRDVAYRRPRASLRAHVAATVLATIALVTWLLPVPGLRPDIPFPILPADEHAGLRFATYIQAQQVEAFRQIRGRLPDVLGETGEPLPGMTYERLDARTYRLGGATERSSVSWVSSDPLTALLREADKRLPALSR